MDFLKKFYAQLSDLYRSLTPSARLTAGLLMAALIVGVALLFRTSVSGPGDYLMGGEPIATPSMVATIHAAFHKKGLTNYEIDGARIRVPKGQAADYMSALVDGGALPPTFGTYLKSAIEKNSLLTPKGQREEMMKFATEQELTRIIQKMDGVDQAAVLYNREAGDGFNQKHITTAMVHITPRGGLALADSRVQLIRKMVAASILGGSPANVTVVVDSTSNPTDSTASVGQLSGAPDSYVATKLEYERTWTQKISQALQGIPGAVVSVNVVLSSELENVENRTVIEPKVVPLEVHETTRTTVTQGAAAGNKPGATGRDANPTPSMVGLNGPSRVEEETTDRHERNLVSEQKLQSRKAGLTPQRVGVSISVPSSYVEQLWRQKNQSLPVDSKPESTVARATVEADLKATIQNLVTPIIGLGAVGDSNSVVSITIVPNLPVPVATITPAPLELATLWLLDNWSTLGLGALAIVALWMVRGLFRADSGSRKTHSGAEAPPRVNDRFEPSPGRATYPVRADRKRASGDSLSDQLVDVVRDDPEAAANVLRTWISAPS